MKVKTLTAAIALAVLASSAALAQAPPDRPAGFRGEFLAQQDRVEKAILGLAEATPADKYGWRPAPGVRSVSEVFIHIVGGNYGIGAFAGIRPPAGWDMETMMKMEKSVTEKAKVIDELKKSFAHLRAGVAAMSDADLEKMVKFFGQDSSVRGILLVAANHEHEHLGQSIAYARMNGITPPWSAEQQKAMKEMMEKKAAPAPAK
jgi:uncharacterized damage-inducible protein DinB